VVYCEILSKNSLDLGNKIEYFNLPEDLHTNALAAVNALFLEHSGSSGEHLPQSPHEEQCLSTTFGAEENRSTHPRQFKYHRKKALFFRRMKYNPMQIMDHLTVQKFNKFGHMDNTCIS
jgi:hypothetical protein